MELERHTSRRHALAVLGTSAAALAGCLGLRSEDDPETGDEDADGSESGSGPGSEDSDADGTTDGAVTWPAIDAGEVISDFENLDEWFARAGEIEAVPDDARTGTQAAAVESDGGTAGMSISFAGGIDLEGWDVSLAVKPESANRLVVEFLAPSRDERLATVRPVPDEYDGWFRLDCGYEHKPEDEPDLSNVTQINVLASGSEDAPTRLVVDDLRRTESVENGKAILAFYGGHDSHYEIAAERLDERGWAGAVPVDPRRVGGGGRMDFDQLARLRDRGWDICTYPEAESDLIAQPEDRRRAVIERRQENLADRGFTDGARHFFAPQWRQMNPSTHEIVRDSHETGFLFGSCPTGAPPTGIHMTPVIWGPALHNGVRRHINLCDQYRQLTVIRIPPIVEDPDEDASVMSLDDFEHLLNHIEHRGLDVITPSELVDGLDGGDAGETGTGSADEDEARPEGQIFDRGATHSFEGEGPAETAAFELGEGLLTGTFSHDVDSALTVDVRSEGDVLANERLSTATATGVGAGTTDGESMLIVSDGTYRLDVDADGPWSIDLEQPAVHADDLAALPIDEAGTGSAFVGPLWTDDSLRLTLTHDGDGPFVVDGYGADGSWEQIANQTGAFENSRSYDASGTVWIDIEADGDWTLTVEQA